MSVRIINQVFDDDRIPGGTPLVVMLALAERADDKGRCWPGMEELAQRARLSVRGIQKVLAKLEEKGLVKRQIGGGRGRSTRYLLLPKTPSAGTGFTETETPSDGTGIEGEKTPSPGTGIEEKPRPDGQGKEAETPSAGTPNKTGTNCETPSAGAHKPRPPGRGNRQEPSLGSGRSSAREDDDAVLDRIRDAAKWDGAKRAEEKWADCWLMLDLHRWRGLGLSDDQIVGVVASSVTSRSEAPDTPAYFNKPMQRYAGDMNRDPLKPTEGEAHDRPARITSYERRQQVLQQEADERRRRLAALVAAKKRGGSSAGG